MKPNGTMRRMKKKMRNTSQCVYHNFFNRERVLFLFCHLKRLNIIRLFIAYFTKCVAVYYDTGLDYKEDRSSIRSSSIL